MTAITTGSARGASQTSLAHVLRAERIKLTTIRSTVWAAILAVVLSAGFVALMAIGLAAAPAEEGTDIDEMISMTFGPTPTLGAVAYALLFAPGLIGVLGALVISSERGTGLLASTVAAVPNRRLILSAKLLASTVLSFVLGAAITVASYAIAEPAFLANGYPVTPMGAGTLQVLFGGALYLAFIGLISTATAFMFRSTAAAVGAVLVLLLFLPGIVSVLPGIGPVVASLLPTALGANIFTPVVDGSLQPMIIGIAGLLAWAGIAITAAAISFFNSDA